MLMSNYRKSRTAFKTAYNYAMASVEHISEQAQQAPDVRLVVDATG